MDSAAGQKVWILQYVTITAAGVSRPQAIPCSSSQNLKRHLCDIIKKNITLLDGDYAAPIMAYLEKKNYDQAILVFRRAQLHNLTIIPFDFWYSEEPEVVL